MVKLIRSLCLVALCCLPGFYAGAQCLVTSIDINTGYNPSTGLAVAPGTAGSPVTDPHWVVVSATSSITGAASAGSPAFVIAPVGGWTSNPAVNPGGWISCIAGNAFSTDGAGTAYNFMLGRPFKVCASDSFIITLKIANDNYISHVDIDGSITLGFSQAAGTATTNYSTFSSFTQTVYLAAGTHILNVLVHNFNLSSYSAVNPTGMDIYGTVSSATGSTSLVYEGDTSCYSRSCTAATPTCNTLTLADSVSFCSGGSTTFAASLAGPDSVLSVRWSPPAGLSDTTIFTPVLSSATTSGYYYVTVSSIIPGSVVVNGNFTYGNSGFSSSYIFNPGPSSVLNEGYYSVYDNPNSVHSGFTSFGDHTTGTGNMLIVNGGYTATDVWCETIPVTPYTDYDFSAWAANCSSVTTGAYVPILQFKINGSLIGAPDTVTASPGTWVNFHAIWNSGSSTYATICIYDALTAASGNDFAIDDITFQKYCKIRDSIYVNVKTPDTSTVKSDTTVCASIGSLTLNAPAGYTNYLWSTGSTSSSLPVSATGTYYVNCTLGCNLLIDTFNVTFIPYISTNTTRDTGYCFPGSLKLEAVPGFSSYLWQDGTAGPKYTVTSSGTYWVVYTGNCENHVDTTHVIPSSLSVNLGPDVSVCSNYTIIPSVNDPAASYLWQDGYTGSTYSASRTGTYSVTVKIGGCVATDDIKVNFIRLSQNIPDTFICKGVPFEIPLVATLPAGGSIIWENGSTNPIRIVRDSGTYWVYVKQNECEILDTVRVVTGHCDCWYDVPTAFTPNADGLNDIIRPKIQPGCTISGYQFSVYNRWGEMVYTTSIPGEGWDGVYKGVPADMGVYYYSLSLFTGIHDKQAKHNGNFTLIR